MMTNISQRSQRKTEPRPQVTCTHNWGRLAVQFSTCASRQTDRQTEVVDYKEYLTMSAIFKKWTCRKWSRTRLVENPL